MPVFIADGLGRKQTKQTKTQTQPCVSLSTHCLPALLNVVLVLALEYRILGKVMGCVISHLQAVFILSTTSSQPES